MTVDMLMERCWGCTLFIFRYDICSIIYQQRPEQRFKTDGLMLSEIKKRKRQVQHNLWTVLIKGVFACNASNAFIEVSNDMLSQGRCLKLSFHVKIARLKAHDSG